MELTSPHRLGSGTSLPKRGLSLSHAEVPPGEKLKAGVGFLISPQLSAVMLDFTQVSKRVAFPNLQVRGEVHRGLLFVLMHTSEAAGSYQLAKRFTVLAVT